MKSTPFGAWAVMLLTVAIRCDAADAQQAAGDAANKAESCVVCHGPAGNSPAGAFPILAGQNSRYIYLQLKDFKEARRKDPLMSPLAQALSKEDMLALADYFSVQKQKPIAFKADAGKVAAGRAKADETLCAMCHLGGFSGQNEIPRVAGQHPEYVTKQLKDFKARTRTNDAGSMTSVAQTLSEQDIENLAHYIANLN
jgi:cytochrome c553